MAQLAIFFLLYHMSYLRKIPNEIKNNAKPKIVKKIFRENLYV